MEFVSVGLEGLLNLVDYPYVGRERVVSKSKSFIVKRDRFGSTRIFHLINGDVVGCFQVYGNIGTNIFVRQDYRRIGISGLLVNKAYKLFPNLKFSSSTNFMSDGMIKKYSK